MIIEGHSGQVKVSSVITNRGKWWRECEHDGEIVSGWATTRAPLSMSVYLTHVDNLFYALCGQSHLINWSMKRRKIVRAFVLKRGR